MHRWNILGFFYLETICFDLLISFICQISFIEIFIMKYEKNFFDSVLIIFVWQKYIFLIYFLFLLLLLFYFISFIHYLINTIFRTKITNHVELFYNLEQIDIFSIIVGTYLSVAYSEIFFGQRFSSSKCMGLYLPKI